jgi:hypothetical protein
VPKCNNVLTVFPFLSVLNHKRELPVPEQAQAHIYWLRRKGIANIPAGDKKVEVEPALVIEQGANCLIHLRIPNNGNMFSVLQKIRQLCIMRIDLMKQVIDAVTGFAKDIMVSPLEFIDGANSNFLANCLKAHRLSPSIQHLKFRHG